MMLPKYFSGNYKPQAQKESTVVSGKCRFTVIFDRLIRIEYDNKGKFCDLPTQGVVNRCFETPSFEVKNKNGVLIIKTKALELSYKAGTKPSAETLKIKLKDFKNEPVWHFGDAPNTLKGTWRTLDGAGDKVPIKNFPFEDGVCSEKGYAVLDESDKLMILPDGFISPRENKVIDIYFFGFGHDYYGATKALYKICGEPPLLPSYVFGNWWSRFHDYTQQEYLDLMNRFEDEDIPLTVSVIDMDWHWSRGSKQGVNEWTGYSWNTDRFPDHKKFLNTLRKKGLYPSLNLHPAEGIQFHEDCYPEMAKAMGVEPETKQTVKFAPENKDFWEPYFRIAHHPLEDEGVEFWWVDWQQGKESGMKGLDPLWALNHFHSLDCQRSDRRPMFFSRYAGTGSERYYVGFSGDTAIKWEVLNFEPYFTSTAANIGYPYWSHDLGGFELGSRDDELYTRWVQFGVFSPVCRLHCTSNDFMGKEPWNYGEDARKNVSDILRLRHSLFPYLYTMNYRTNTELKALCTPLYYEYPEEKNAYRFKNEYFFGSEMLVCPVTTKADKKSLLSKTAVWLPDGVWTDAFSGIVYKGGRAVDMYRSLSEVPVFLKAGAIVPENCHIKGDNSQTFRSELQITVAPGADNSFTLYEDKGVDKSYLNGDFTKTEMNLCYSDKKAVFKINAPGGNTALLPEKRSFTVCFKGFNPLSDVSVLVNGKKADFKTETDEGKNSLFVTVCAAAKDNITITLENENGFIYNNSAVLKRGFEILLHSLTDNSQKPGVYDVLKGKNIPLLNRTERLDKIEGVNKSLYCAIRELIDVLQ